MNLNDLSQEIHAENVERGFWEGGKEGKNIGEALMLITSELAEALEADRKDRYCSPGSALDIESQYPEQTGRGSIFKTVFESHVKDTFEDEIADAAIRLLDLAGGLGIDLDRHIRLKLRYNRLRSYKGKKY